ncbi:hypothetical protein [Rhodococcus pyridinivorans]|uniref:hypothetical protein n=2 Tax=Rhodococcus TaxID=1827 RepID=UPI002658A568|nr:hypothetical protein [Rhodococcus pyridinivorans]
MKVSGSRVITGVEPRCTADQPAHEPDELEERIRYAGVVRTPHPITDSNATELMEQGVRRMELAAALRATGHDYRARVARVSP